MTKKVYSGIDKIPQGTASDKVTEGCLVLEGGAFRGLYTQGFLDALMVNDINLQTVIGVSAGALGGVNYISGQIGRAGRVNLGFRHDSRYVGTKAFLNSRSILDISFLTEERGILEPFDWERFNNTDRRFIAVATNCHTGRPTCFENKKCDDIMLGIRASATMPYISPMVRIDGVPYLDGGCSCKIPYLWAIKKGFKKIIVIKTREASFRKEEAISKMPFRVYRKYPKLARRMALSNLAYNKQCDEIERLHRAGRLLRFAPSRNVTVTRIEKDMEKLGKLYWLGWKDCCDNLDRIRKYLEIR